MRSVYSKALFGPLDRVEMRIAGEENVRLYASGHG